LKDVPYLKDRTLATCAGSVYFRSTMHEYAVSAILGLVQGLTEFLPVSSTGHQIIVSALMGLHGERIAAFEVVIQFGSVLAVLFLYRQRFLSLFFPRGNGRFAGAYGLWLLFLTSLPASLLGFFFHVPIKTHLFTPLSVSLALVAGVVFILGTEARKRPTAYDTLDSLTPALALGIGLFQCLALWPGFSRSTATIMGALLLGATRVLAAEYSFLAAVPVITGAAGLSLVSSVNSLRPDDIPFFAIGTLVSFLASLGTIKILIRLISGISFRPFAWYRLLLASAAFFLFYG
jgi:undecaprenyl-diphosphatase